MRLSGENPQMLPGELRFRDGQKLLLQLLLGRSIAKSCDSRGCRGLPAEPAQVAPA